MKFGICSLFFFLITFILEHFLGVTNSCGNAENARVKKAGAITYGKPSKQKILRYKECLLEQNGLRWSLKYIAERAK